MTEGKTTTENEGRGISRRSFMKGMTAAGFAFAAVSSGLKKPALADSYVGSSHAADLSDERLIWMYDLMLKARHFDIFLADKIVLGDKVIRTRPPALHMCCGQEASAMGPIAAMTKDDWIFATHRCTSHCVMREMDLGKMMAAAIYKATGYGNGRGSHYHISDLKLKFPNNSGQIGSQANVAVGTAYAQMVLNKRNGTNDIVVKFSGDGDFNCAETLSGLNEAAKFGLPIVFVCENNGQQIWVRTQDTMKIKDVAERGKGFGIPSRVVDGQDVLAVYNVAKEAVDRARAGGGPTLIEAKTYRHFDHAGVRGYKPGGVQAAFGLGYRSDRETKQWLTRDPLKIFKEQLIAMGVMDEKKADEMTKKAKKAVEDAWNWSLDQPITKPETTLEKVFLDGPVTTEVPRQLANCPLYEGGPSLLT